MGWDGAGMCMKALSPGAAPKDSVLGAFLEGRIGVLRVINRLSDKFVHFMQVNYAFVWQIRHCHIPIQISDQEAKGCVLLEKMHLFSRQQSQVTGPVWLNWWGNKLLALSPGVQ
uniref:Uncharacterized protein n=1 Tax=Setaria digitata TaxID=48799 RepID=A0A915PS51_9BILA